MKDGTQELPESSRNALIRMAEALRRGFTGRFELECNQGGIREMRELRVVPSGELKDGGGQSS